MVRTLNALCMAFFLATVLFGAAIADGYVDEDVIEYREHIMRSLDEQTAILGQIVSYSIPNDNVIAHLDALALLASTALRSFEAQVPGGESKPEVWSNWDDFSDRMIELSDKIKQAADSARINGKDEALTNILNVLTCKDCHEVYREETE